MQLKITSIFYSVQGEGSHTGTAAIFIRFHGCNLSCSFCDDTLHTGSFRFMSPEKILDEIAAYPARFIVLTGGEPTLYPLNPFICFLQEHGYYVSIESNGYCLENVSQADWITYSPKEWTKLLRKGYDEIKFIVSKDSPLHYLLNFQSDKPIYVQPQNLFDLPDIDNVRFCVDLVKKYPRFRLSVQLHKFLGLE
ncbi:7-carboxy-7-deazaguanine synthase QueE [Nitratifractor sp.]